MIVRAGVLTRDGVATGGSAEEEILTDVATALVGFGILMRRLRSREQRFFGPGTKLGWSISGPGYLLPQELDYVLAQRELLKQAAEEPTASIGDGAT